MHTDGSWLSAVPLNDPLKEEQALLVQRLLLALLGMSALAALVTLSATSAINRAVGLATSAMFAALLRVAFFVLRRGALTAAVALTSIGVTLLALANMAPSGLGGSRAIFTLLVAPILLGGLVGSGRLLWTNAAIVSISVIALTLLEQAAPSLIGYSPSTYDPLLTCLSFVLIVVILALMADRLSRALRGAVLRATSREQELEQLRASLEGPIRLGRSAGRQAANTSSVSQIIEFLKCTAIASSGPSSGTRYRRAL